jgi:hypothetical protein
MVELLVVACGRVTADPAVVSGRELELVRGTSDDELETVFDADAAVATLEVGDRGHPIILIVERHELRLVLGEICGGHELPRATRVLLCVIQTKSQRLLRRLRSVDDLDEYCRVMAGATSLLLRVALILGEDFRHIKPEVATVAAGGVALEHARGGIGGELEAVGSSTYD